LIKKIIVAKKLRCSKKEFIWSGILYMRFISSASNEKFAINYALHSLFCFCIIVLLHIVSNVEVIFLLLSLEIQAENDRLSVNPLGWNSKAWYESYLWCSCNYNAPC